MEEWKDKMKGSEQESDLWLKVNTKNCPKCKVRIEKNMGCMHMTCKKCKYEFCWLCMGDYKKHKQEVGTKLCNSYEEVQKAKRLPVAGKDTKRKAEFTLKKLEHFK